MSVFEVDVGRCRWMSVDVGGCRYKRGLQEFSTDYEFDGRSWRFRRREEIRRINFGGFDGFQIRRNPSKTPKPGNLSTLEEG